MPNRLIKDSFRTSDKIASLTDFEFRLWVSLIVSVDDAGRGDARPAIIKGNAFPLRERVTAKDINDALHGLAAKGCVSLYEVDGSPTFGSRLGPNIKGYENANQNIPTRRKTAALHRLRKSAASCRKLRRIAASCGLNPIRIRILILIRIQVPPHAPPRGAGLPNFGRNIPRKSGKEQQRKHLSASSRISRPLTA